jgi:hypothetical protein
MNIIYVKFVSLVLEKVNHGFPIMPFEVHGMDSRNQLSFHYKPSVDLVHFGGDLGICLGHYEDNDSRHLSALTCDDAHIIANPDILVEAVEMGFAAWGGKVLTPQQALVLANHLQPARQIVRHEVDDEVAKTFNISEISLDINNVLTRTVTVVE